ncbi:class I SAM-dependent methyltransferase [Roseofilum sp. BLCC_M154]|uniref:Class I SAM-dependent methyltransferase n=1 Tax=Roseofilum acuticapitatum BLCC-M154 TaxID=3022444 RepID=A0ABT7AMJ8_9CYAN|nr:class I SAM-dependent methyltransferase [Roseofilum acuticapitatum]MDJ1168121.1 class I SAM-dependent methyltransferase [Roseofilum acuticapitatum BLCC-M154]
MSLIRRSINLLEHTLTSSHIAWWKLKNKIYKYEVDPYSPRYWWTRQEVVFQLCESTLLNPENWHNLIYQPHFQFYDERLVEYSWAIKQITPLGKSDRFLDVGCVMNTPYTLRKLINQFMDIHLLNLVSEPLAMQGRISFHSQDVRSCDLPHGSFDCITCISTLEHVGGDNQYNDFSENGSAELTLDSGLENQQGLWKPAFTALLKLIKPGGLLLVTMPCGFEQQGVWQKGEYRLGIEELEEFQTLAAQFDREVKITLMKKSVMGWKETSVEEINTDRDPQERLRSFGADVVVLVQTIIP